MTRVVRACLAACMVAVAFGCNPGEPEPTPGGGTPGPTPSGTQDDAGMPADAGQGPMARLRVVHASPGAPAVDVYAQGSTTPLVTNLAYTETSPFAQVPADSYTLEVRPAGSDPSSPAVYTVGPVALADGSTTTAVAAGLLSSTAMADSFRVIPLTHGFGEAAPGTARVRVVHAGADAPAVDLDVGDDGTAELTNVDRFADSGPEGVSLPSGMMLQIGVIAQGSRVTAFTTPALPDTAELFLIATGLLSEKARAESGFGILAVGPDGTVGLVRQNPIVYALHASPDAPAVDLFVGDAQLTDNLAFGALTAPIQVAPGAYTIDFFPYEAGATRPVGMPAASEAVPSLEAGERYLVIATGFLTPTPEETELQLFSAAEAFADAGMQARARVIHASPDAPAVDVGVMSGTMFTPLMGLTNLEYLNGSAPEGIEVAPGALTIGVAPTGETTPAATFDVSFTAGQEAFIVAAGALTPVPKKGEEQAFQLIAIDTAQSPWTAAAVSPR